MTLWAVKRLGQTQRSARGGIPRLVAPVGGATAARGRAAGNPRRRPPLPSDGPRWPAMAPLPSDGPRWPAMAPLPSDGPRWPAMAPATCDGPYSPTFCKVLAICAANSF
jgi:hypothetical protein